MADEFQQRREHPGGSRPRAVCGEAGMALGSLHPSSSFPWAQSPGMCPNSTLPQKNWGKSQCQAFQHKPGSSSPQFNCSLLYDYPNKSLLIPALPHLCHGCSPSHQHLLPPWRAVGTVLSPCPIPMLGKPFLASRGIFSLLRTSFTN